MHKRKQCRYLLHNLTAEIKFFASSIHLTLLKLIHLIGTQKKKKNLIQTICRCLFFFVSLPLPTT